MSECVLLQDRERHAAVRVPQPHHRQRPLLRRRDERRLLGGAQRDHVGRVADQDGLGAALDVLDDQGRAARVEDARAVREPHEEPELLARVPEDTRQLEQRRRRRRLDRRRRLEERARRGARLGARAGAPRTRPPCLAATPWRRRRRRRRSPAAAAGGPADFAPLPTSRSATSRGWAAAAAARGARARCRRLERTLAPPSGSAKSRGSVAGV